MKQFIILFCSVSIMGTSYGQSFQSIYGDSSTTWSLIKEANIDFVCSSFYSPESDTTINVNTYAVLPNYGFIREDSTVGKVWFFNEIWNQEYLVMDLSLNATDTFIIYDWVGTPEIFTVDSINVLSGRKHVYLNGNINILSINDEQLIFVEGSGPNAGFNYQRSAGGAYMNSYMLCHSKNDIKVQGNTLFMDTCEVCMVGIEELDHASMELIKVCDFLGRETPVKKNTPLLYYYSDGTIRKVLITD